MTARIVRIQDQLDLAIDDRRGRRVDRARNARNRRAPPGGAGILREQDYGAFTLYRRDQSQSSALTITCDGNRIEILIADFTNDLDANSRHPVVFRAAPARETHLVPRE